MNGVQLQLAQKFLTQPSTEVTPWTFHYFMLYSRKGVEDRLMMCRLRRCGLSQSIRIKGRVQLSYLLPRDTADPVFHLSLVVRLSSINRSVHGEDFARGRQGCSTSCLAVGQRPRSDQACLQWTPLCFNPSTEGVVVFLPCDKAGACS